MYQLITYPAGFGAFSFSPFCIKAAWLLNKAGVAWERRDENDPRKYPHGKLPCLQVGEDVIHDSTNIRRFLEGHGADYWGETPPRDRAYGQALIRMAEEHMYFHGVIDRWVNTDVWPHIREAYFVEIPKVIRGVVTGSLRKNLKKGLETQGLMRLSAQERAEKLEADLQAIATLLEGQDFLLGDHPTLPDYSVAAMLVSMHKGPVETALTKRVSGDPALMGYITRMTEACE